MAVSVLDDMYIDGAYRDYASRCNKTSVQPLADLLQGKVLSQKQLFKHVHAEFYRTLDRGDDRTQILRAQLSLPGA